MSLTIRDEDGVLLKINELDGKELVLELDGVGDFSPYVEPTDEGDKTMIRFTFGDNEGAVSRATIRVQEASTIE